MTANLGAEERLTMHRVRIWAGRAGRFARGAPATSTLVIALWLVGAGTGSLLTGPSPALMSRFGVGVDTLAAGRWWAPFTAMFFSSGLPGYALITAALLAACAPLERRIGSLRAATVLVASHALGCVIAVGLIAFGARTGDIWAGHLSASIDVGASPAAAGLVFAASRRLAPLWRRRIRVVTAAMLVTAALYAGGFADVSRLTAALISLPIGALVVPAHPRARHDVPRRDRRALVALIVAAAAIGPLSSLGAAQRFGPLSALDFLFLPSLKPGDVMRWCVRVTANSRGECASATTAFLVQGIGPLIQTLLPVLVLLVLAEGLRRGRRAAMIGTVVVNVALATLGGALSRNELVHLLNAPVGAEIGSSELWVVRLAPIALPLSIAVLVLVYRAQFPIRMPQAARRRWLGIAVVGAAAVAGGYIAFGWLMRRQFEPTPTIGALLASVPERFAPVGFVAGRGDLFPIGAGAVALYRWAGAIFWAVVLVATLVGFWRVRSADATTDRVTAGEILRRDSGGNTLAHMTLWRGNHYAITADESTFIAYRVIAGVAVTTGDPIGPHPAAAIDEFVSTCAAAGWTASFFSVTARTAELLRFEGFHTLQVASDTVLDPRTLTFEGKQWQHLRAAFHRAERLGVRAHWSAFDDLPSALATQVRDIDRQWLAGKQLPEMGFTLGGLAELRDPAVRCLLAIDGADRVCAVTSWLPGYRAGKQVGWTLDFMRRAPDSFTGAIEFLIGTALKEFRAQRADYVSLSGVPLVWPDGGRPPGTLGRAMEAIAGLMEPVYGFRSLLRFKAKFAPTYVPLYLAYPDPSALPTVTNAVLRAYVPHVGPAELGRLLRRLLSPAS